MLKNLVFLSVIAATFLFIANPALAQFGLDATAQKAQYSETNIYSTISTIISFGLSLAGLVFLGIMFYAGLRWMTARGNEEFVTKAKNAMFAALIGFILVTLSYGISTFVFGRLLQ